ncbi:MAG: type I restriction endonuclease subunit R [Anaerolineae bacterium]
MNLDAEQALENATMQLFAGLGWQTANAYYEAFTPEAATPTRPYLGRRDDGAVLLLDRLRAALKRLNPDLPPEAREAAVTELARGRGMMSPVEANRQVYKLLKDGVSVEILDPTTSERQVYTVRVIDWRAPARNDFLLVQQLWIQGELHRRRPDLVGFVNGIPLLFGELKAHHRRLSDAYTHNLSDYKTTIPHLFWYTGLVVLSNGSQGVVGNLSARFNHFSTWKKVHDEQEKGVIAWETLVRATCTPARLLDLVENYTLYHKGEGGLTKITAKNHQFLGVENVMAALAHIRENRGKLGVFWHTQGSGKSFSMIFFAQKVLRTVGGHWTFVIVTDRQGLDAQIYKNFARSGVTIGDEKQVRAQNGEHLKQLLRGDQRYIFTLIQKFHTRSTGDSCDRPYPVLSERDDIIVMTDEAHRSQYADLAMNMRRALPNAAFIGFTGTPLMAGEEELTREVFGDYVSIYNFKQSMDDGATVPLFYENRIPELQLANAELNAEMEALLEQALVDDASRDESEEALARQFVREYELITRDDRLDKIAEDLVEHFVGRGYRGKAMVVSIDKLTTVKMYHKVQTHWQRKLESLRAQRVTAGPVEALALDDLIAYMTSTDMAVVISQAQNEVSFFVEHGYDIRPHRERMVKGELDEKFKKADDPLRLAFVCAMWRTGFDAPACSTIYLDRPMRNHALMQTIARANRVFGEKVNGLIVDYIGIFRELQEALAIYATGKGAEVGEYPIKDKAALVDDLRAALDDVADFCTERGVNLDALLSRSRGVFEHIAAIDTAVTVLVDAQMEEAADDAVEQIIVNDEFKLRFLNLVAGVDRLYRAILPDPCAAEFSARRRLLLFLAQKIRNLRPDVALPDIEPEVTDLLDASITARAYVIQEPPTLYDLGKVDFEALKQRFAEGRKHTEAEKLRGTLNALLQRMVRRNRRRVDYQEEYRRLIDAYNGGSANVETFFQELVDLAQQLNAEEQRHVRENLSEEELAIFDILTRPGPELSDAERKAVKQIARDLLAKLKREKLVLDWRKRQQYRAAVRLMIQDVLDQRLPARYDTELYNQKCDDVYAHIYDSYGGAGQSIYAAA